MIALEWACRFFKREATTLEMSGQDKRGHSAIYIQVEHQSFPISFEYSEQRRENGIPAFARLSCITSLRNKRREGTPAARIS